MKTYYKQSTQILVNNFDKALKSILQSDLNKIKGRAAKK
jgi:hypothetical protein